MCTADGRATAPVLQHRSRALPLSRPAPGAPAGGAGRGRGGNERLDLLTEAGFRRSQGYLYKPVCPDCRACVPVRIVVAGFRPGRSFRRVLARNSRPDRQPELAAVATDEQFALFQPLSAPSASGRRHGAHGPRRPMPRWSSWRRRTTRLIEFRDRSGRLAGVSLTDFVRSGLSGVYKFFDPTWPQRSLGSFIILWHVEHARGLGLPLRLSRLLDRREPQDGLQGALRAARMPGRRVLAAVRRQRRRELA